MILRGAAEVGVWGVERRHTAMLQTSDGNCYDA